MRCSTRAVEPSAVEATKPPSTEATREAAVVCPLPGRWWMGRPEATAHTRSDPSAKHGGDGLRIRGKTHGQRLKLSGRHGFPGRGRIRRRLVSAPLSLFVAAALAAAMALLFRDWAAE